VTNRVGVIGGGIIGLAVARRLLQVRPGASVEVLEKEEALAQHQSGHNSGVVHAGVYYEPGSSKARLCTYGRRLLEEFCERAGVPYRVCGKLVVALDDQEVVRLRLIHERAEANGVPGLRMLDPHGITEVEPHARGLLALQVPSTAIVDFAEVCRALGRDVITLGGHVTNSFRVTARQRGARSVGRRGARV
jgi:L-2-hydroxyglutarate oxidase